MSSNNTTTDTASAESAGDSKSYITSTITRHLPTEKIAALTRLASSTFSRKEKHPPIVFPPPSWSLDESKGDGVGSSPIDLERTSEAQHQNQSAQPVAEDPPPEPAPFAHWLRNLIEGLPLPTSGPLVTSTNTAPEGPPVPDVVDPKLMRQLSSEELMTGSGSTRSVWSVLEGLRRGKGKGGQVPAIDECEGIMMYSPLQPTKDSELQLADTESVLEYIDEPPVDEPSKTGEADATAGTEDKGKAKQPTSAPVPEPTRPTLLTEKWVPSTTQLSLQTTWWGYRLYLPPPVMAVLNDGHIKAAQRGAMITTALKWILDRVPMMMVPPTLKPAVLAMKRLGPLLGYIGVFIAWSWGALSKRDAGE